jgi:hypothetical protein
LIIFFYFEAVLVLAQLDFVIGTMLLPNDVQKAKGFVGYSTKNFKDNMWSAYTTNEQVIILIF